MINGWYPKGSLGGFSLILLVSGGQNNNCLICENELEHGVDKILEKYIKKYLESRNQLWFGQGWQYRKIQPCNPYKFKALTAAPTSILKGL